MTIIVLLEELKKFIEEQTKDVILSVRGKKSDEPQHRAAEVHLMRLPDVEAETKRIPYIVLQFITGKDDQTEGLPPESECRVRIVFAAYSEDGGAGAMDVLNLITRVRVALLKAGEVGNQFLLRKPLEYIVYPDDTPPYYMGEMLTIWEMPEVYREIDPELYGN